MKNLKRFNIPSGFKKTQKLLTAHNTKLLKKARKEAVSSAVRVLSTDL